MNGYEYRPTKKSRVQQINENLLNNIKTIYRLRKVQYTIIGDKFICAYVISLSKNHRLSLEDQVLSVFNHLKSILLPNETLVTENKCLKIVSNLYEAEYYFEAWQKHADQLAYIQDGKVVTELLRRMSCEQAALIFRKHKIEPLDLLNKLEVLQTHKTPAEKYAALAKMPILLKETHAKERRKVCPPNT